MTLDRSTRRHGSRIRQFGWVAAAGMILVAALAPTASGAGHIMLATVTGHAPASAASNEPSFWGEDCTKIDSVAGSLGDSYVLGLSYDLVVVKAGSGDNANTLFADASAGETVWADTNGDGLFNPGGEGGDKDISHIIFCGPAETTTTTESETTTETDTTTESETTTETDTTTESETTTETDTTTESETTTETDTTTESETTTETTDESPTGGELGVVGTPGVTPPSTDTVAAISQPANVDGFRMVLVGLAALLVVTLLFVQPTKAAKERVNRR